MFKNIFILAFLFVSYFGYAEELIVTAKMICQGSMNIASKTATEVKFADGDYSELKNLFVKNNDKLTNLVIPDKLPSLRSLHILENPKLSSLVIPGALISLIRLDISDTSLTRLVIPSALRALIHLDISDNSQLTSLVIPGTLTALRVLSVSSNSQLSSLVIPETLSALSLLSVDNNSLLTSLTFLGAFRYFTNLYVSHNLILSSLVMDNVMVNRSHQLAFIAPRTPETLAIAARGLDDVRFETEDVTVAAYHAPIGGAGAPIAIIGQEALTALQKQTVAHWVKFSNDQSSLLKAYLPGSHKQAVTEFDDNVYLSMKKNLENLIKIQSIPNEKFRLKVALQALELLHGKSTIPTYRGTEREEYRTISINGMPSNLQLVVFLYHLLEEQIISKSDEFVQNWIAENYTSKFEVFKGIFPKYSHYAFLGEVLNPSDKEGKKLVSALSNILRAEEYDSSVFGEKIPVNVIAKISKEFNSNKSLDMFNPMYEALFMTIRGHNNKLFDAAEWHKPACAFGSYLQMLRVLSDPSFALLGADAFGSFEIVPCAP